MDNDIECFFQPEYRIGISLSQNTCNEMNAFNPTIIHVTAPDFTCCHVIAYAIQRDIPLIGTYHSNLIDYLSFYPGNKFVTPMMNAFFNHMYNFMIKLYVPTQATKEHLMVDDVTDVKIWGRGVNTTIFSPTHRTKTFPGKLGIASDSTTTCPIILFVGRLVKEKGIDIVVEVIRRLNASNVSFHAVIVGEGSFDTHFVDEPNTTLLGWLDGHVLSEAYASSDIFLFPSTVETFGNVTLEAMASGLPIIAASSCSSHLVKDQINGYLCDDGDIGAFYDATLKLVQDKNMRASFSAASFEMGKSMSKGVVMREMLTNYVDVQNQFENEFQRSHYNHLQSKKHWPGTFRFGMNPLPRGWSTVEFVLVCILRYLNFISHNVLRKFWRDKSNVDFEKKQIDTSKGSIATNFLISVGDSRVAVWAVMVFCSFYSCFSSFTFPSVTPSYHTQGKLKHKKN